MHRIGAVILAAGYSKRQNGFKPLLPLGDKTVLEHCLHLFKDRGLRDIVVVLGHRAEELSPLVNASGAKTVLNPDYDQGMFSSVQVGVASLSASSQAFFVLPVDIPLIRFLSIDCLVKAFRREKKADVLVPTFQNKTGHPPLIRDNLQRAILEHDGTQGLRGVLNKSKIINVEVPDRHILLDIDTPEEYQKVLMLWERYSLPSPEEAQILLKWECQENKEVIVHCQKVAQVAKEMAQTVNAAGDYKLDAELVEVGALLHDIAKGEVKHTIAGAKRLEVLGFSQDLANIVANHADYDPDPESPVNETEIVYLADKLVKGAEFIGLDRLFEDKYQIYIDNPEALQAVQRRWKQARKIYERIEQACNYTLNLKYWIERT